MHRLTVANQRNWLLIHKDTFIFFHAAKSPYDIVDYMDKREYTRTSSFIVYDPIEHMPMNAVIWYKQMKVD